MIKLYGFGPAFGLIDPSPFVAKVHLFLTLHGIEFIQENNVNALGKAPKKKFPFIDDEGSLVADSSTIVKYLAEKHSIKMDAWMSDEQRATSHLISKSLEENLYWCLVHSRWINEDTWDIVRQHYFGDMPFPLNTLVPMIARNGTKKRINGHGMGAHSEDEVLEIARQSFAALATLLGEKNYMFGDTISTLDLVVFAQVGAFTLSNIDDKATRLAKEYDNLVGLTNRIYQNNYQKT